MADLCTYIKLDETMYQEISKGVQGAASKTFIDFKRRYPEMFTLPSSGGLFFDNQDDFDNFIIQCYLYQHSYEYAIEGKKLSAEPEERDSCEWPDCLHLGTDRDHIIPQSVIKKTSLNRKISADKVLKKLWMEFNSALLCRRHNQNVKNDSIGVGLWLLSRLKD